MKRVTDKHSVAHLWANQEQDEARTPTGNLYFNHNGIFSYGSHFMIGRHVENARGEHAVLLTSRTYSRTTNAQITIVRQASRHLKQIIVPDPDNSRDWQMEKWYEEIKATARSLEGARKPGKYIMEIDRIMAEAKAYANFFGTELPELLIEAGNIQNSEQYSEVVKHEVAFRETQELIRKKEHAKRQSKNLKLWRTFKSGRISTYDGFDYLRYNPVSESVETSQRVEIPAGVAKQFYALVMETNGKGGCENCKTRLMDRYEVYAINKDFIVVGCHKISLKEIKAFSKKMGW